MRGRAEAVDLREAARQPAINRSLQSVREDPAIAVMIASSSARTIMTTMIFPVSPPPPTNFDIAAVTPIPL
jgi:hypothetical protein